MFWHIFHAEECSNGQRKCFALSFSTDINCIIDMDGQQQACDVDVKQSYDGNTSDITVSFDWPHLVTGFPKIEASDSGTAVSIQSKADLIATSIQGHVSNGLPSATKVVSKAKSLELYHGALPAQDQSVNILFYLANFPRFTRSSVFQVSAGGIQVEFQYAGDGRVNRKAVVSNVQFCQVTAAQSLVDDLCWLCSLAAGCFVTCPRTEILVDGAVVLTRLENKDLSMPDIGKPLVHDKVSATILRQFLESSVAPFRKYTNDYSLQFLIHLGLLAKHHHYLQTRALVMSDFLEILRDRYARTASGPNGIFKRKGSEFYWKHPPRRRVRSGFWNLVRAVIAARFTRRYKASFQEIISQFCSDHRLGGWDNDFKKLRNEIMHTGDFKGPNKLSRYRNLHHFCDRVLLALLDWDRCGGTYIPHHRSVSQSNTHISVNRVTFTR